MSRSTRISGGETSMSGRLSAGDLDSGSVAAQRADLPSADAAGSGSPVGATLLVGAGGFATIQEAVDAASDGDIIQIAGGTYVEQVVIDGKNDLTLIAAPGEEVIIQAPSDLVETARTSSDREVHSVVTVLNGANIVLQDLEVDGDGRGGTVDEGGGAGQAQFTGVFYRDASGGLVDVDITGVRDAYAPGTTPGGNPVISGVQRGVALQVDNSTQLDFAMSGGSISDFQKNATVFNNAILDVSGVTITGGGDQTVNAQNGIQALNCTGTIADNILTAIGYAGPADAYSGIMLLYQNTDLDITGNTITGSNDESTLAKVVGIFVLDFGVPSNGGEISGNLISFVDTGIGVYGDINGIAIHDNEISDIDVTDPFAAGVDFQPSASITAGFEVEGTDAADLLLGAGGGDTLSGLGGADTIDGGAGADSMSGGAGDDSYAVDDAGDQVVELDGEGVDTVTTGLSHTLADNVENLVLTGAGNLTGTGNEEDNTLTGNGGANTLTGAGGNDTLIGGGGIDTADYAGAVTLASDGLGGWTATSAGEGTDTLQGIEKVSSADGATLLVGDGGYATIQEAIDAASAGDTIMIAAGTYTGNVTVDKDGLTIIAEDGAELVGTFMTDNGFDERVDVELRTATGYTGAAGVGLTIDADDVTIQGLRIAEYLSGVAFGDNVDGLTLDGVTIEDTVGAIRKGDPYDVTNLSIIGGLIAHSVHGIEAYTLTADGKLDGVLIDGTTFEHLMSKGIYVEALSNALFTDLVMNDVGEFGRGPAFGGAGPTLGGFGAGIDINLKYGDYENIVIDGFSFTDVGSSNRSGAGPEHAFGGAITLKARDDAPSYNGSPASFDGAIVITNGVITGTSTAIRTGEPGKGNADPSVEVSNVTISGESFDYDNATNSVFHADGTGAADGIFANFNATGAFDIDGGAGNDTIATGLGADTITGGLGNDTILAGDGVDTVAFAGALADYAITFPAGPVSVADTNAGDGDEGTDSLVGVEKLSFSDATVLLVGAGGYASIQEAIDAAQAGDVIVVSAGDYDEDLTIDKAVTIMGAQAGVAGADPGRTASSAAGETSITGEHHITAAGAVILDGLRFVNDASTSGNGPSNPTLYVGTGFDHVVTNSVFWSTLAGGANGVDDRAIGLHGVAGGEITISNNYITGASAGGFGTASWGRGVWYDGGTGADVLFEGNTFEYTRTALNLDMSNGALASVQSNLFRTNGTAVSVGFTADNITFADNGYANVGDEFNFRNVTDDVVFDAEAAVGSVTPVAPAADLVVVLAGEGDDLLQGTSGADYLDDNAAGASFESSTAADNDTMDGRGGNDLLVAEAGDDSLIGGSGNDTLDGGSGGDTLAGGADDDSYLVNDAGDDIVELDGGGTDTVTASLSHTLADNVEKLVLTGAGDLTGTGNDEANTLTGNAGANTLSGAGGNDTLIGGGGIDTASYAGAVTLASDGLGGWTATGEGTDTLQGIEKVSSVEGTTLLVGAGGYATIQAAIDAASAGDTIMIAAGDYSGNINVNKAGLTIIAEDGAVLTGSFLTDNSFDERVDVELRTATGYSGAAGAGLTISANDVTIQGLKIAAYLTGVEIGEVSGLTLVDVDIEDTVNGYRKSTMADISDLQILGGLLSHSVFGINFAKANDLTQGFVDGMTVDGVTFEHLMEKGIYTETLSHGLLTNLTMTDVGEFGRGPAFGGTGPNLGGFGAGIDINLKHGDYTDIVIDGFSFTDVGSSNGGGSEHPFGGAITLKARADGPSYNTNPASFDGAIVVTNGVITGTSTAIRAGEPGKGNADPAVEVSDVTVSGESFDYDNASQSVFHADGTSAADAILTNTAATGAFDIDGGAGNDTISTGLGADTIRGGLGNDAIAAGGGSDTAAFDGTRAGHLITLGAGAVTVQDTALGDGDTGSDTLSGVETLSFADGDVLIVGAGGGFATIQAAIDAASDGDVIMVAAGAYDEDLDIDKAVTILGAKAGLAGNGGSRSPFSATGETSLTGDHRITASGAVTIDGLRFVNDASTSGNGPSNPTLYVGTGFDHLITNSIFWSTAVGGANGVDDRAIGLHGVGGGDITISNNYIGGPNVGSFSTASWGRGVWYDGGVGSNADITGNTFQNVRTGLNLDLSNDATATVSGNGFSNNGTAISVGFTADNITFGDNAFDLVGDNFNFRNVTDDVVFDAELAVGAVNPADPTDLVVVLAGEGDDLLQGSSHADYLDDNAAGAPFESSTAVDNDTLDGRGGNDLLVAEAGADSLIGGTGNDTLVGGSGADTMAGGANDDSYSVEDAGDVVTELSGEGVDLVTSTVSHTLSANVENLTLATGAGNIDGGGNGQGNILTGNAGDNRLTGGGGADQVFGGDGTDTAVFGGNAAGYTISFGAGVMTVADTIAAGGDDGTDTLTAVEALSFADGEMLIVDASGAFGDFTSIQDAIDAASAGDTILVRGGTYNESVDVDKDVTLISAGGLAIINGQGTNPSSSHAVTLSANGATLGGAGKGFTINAGPNEAAAILLDADGVVIEGNVIHAATGASHERQGLVSNGGVNNVVVRANSFTGDATQLAYIQGPGSSNVDILNNIFSGNGSETSLLFGATGSEISGNVFNGTGGGAMILLEDGNDVGANDFSASPGPDIVTSDSDFDMSQTPTAREIEAHNAGQGVNYTGNALANTMTGNVDDASSGPPLGALAAPGDDDDFNDTLRGAAGKDTLYGLGGDDRLIGGFAVDSMVGGTGDDTYFVDLVDDEAVELAGEGHDAVSASVNRYTLAANVEDLAYTGADDFRGDGNDGANRMESRNGADRLTGHAGNDTLIAGNGKDRLEGDAGADSMVGGNGGDKYVVDSFGDVIVETNNGGADTVISGDISLNLANYANVEHAALSGSLDLNLTGNNGVNALIGNAGANRINGGNGADILTGGAGADTFDYNTVGNSPKDGVPDRITDFQLDVDIIDLLGIDAKESVGGNNAFTWIDTAAFTGEGQLRYYFKGGTTVIEGNTDADNQAELQIVLDGHHVLYDGAFAL